MSLKTYRIDSYGFGTLRFLEQFSHSWCPGSMVTMVHEPDSVGMVVSIDDVDITILWSRKQDFEASTRVTHVQSVSRKLGVTFTSLPSVTIPESIDIVTAPMTTEA